MEFIILLFIVFVSFTSIFSLLTIIERRARRRSMIRNYRHQITQMYLDGHEWADVMHYTCHNDYECKEITNEVYHHIPARL